MDALEQASTTAPPALGSYTIVKWDNVGAEINFTATW